MKPLTSEQAAILSLSEEPSHVKWIEEAVQLRSNPGIWYELTQRASENGAWSFSLHITNGRKAAFRPAGQFESRVRGRTVFARYVGPATKEKP
jgi:hypothetical protein